MSVSSPFRSFSDLCLPIFDLRKVECGVFTPFMSLETRTSRPMRLLLSFPAPRVCPCYTRAIRFFFLSQHQGLLCSFVVVVVVFNINTETTELLMFYCKKYWMCKLNDKPEGKFLYTETINLYCIVVVFNITTETIELLMFFCKMYWMCDVNDRAEGKFLHTETIKLHCTVPYCNQIIILIT